MQYRIEHYLPEKDHLEDKEHFVVRFMLNLIEIHADEYTDQFNR